MSSLRQPFVSGVVDSSRAMMRVLNTSHLFDASPVRSTIPFVNRRSSFFSRRRGHTLEHTAGVCPVIPYTPGLTPASEDIPLPQIISWCCVKADYALVDLVMASYYFSHVKNFLIDWLIDWTLITYRLIHNVMLHKHRFCLPGWIYIYIFISPLNGSTKFKKTLKTATKQSSTLAQHEGIYSLA